LQVFCLIKPLIFEFIHISTQIRKHSSISTSSYFLLANPNDRAV
jgi:hypothetical protein